MQTNDDHVVHHKVDEAVHEEDVKLTAEDKVEAYNEEIKVPHETHKHVAGQLPPWAYVLLGALGGAILLLLLSYTYNGWNIPGENGRGMMGGAGIRQADSGGNDVRPDGRQILENVLPVNTDRNVFRSSPFSGRFRAMGMMNDNFFDEFDNMQRIHDQMTGNLVIDNLGGDLGTKKLSGSLSFYSGGKQYSMPYILDNRKLILKPAELGSYLNANRNARVSISILDYSNRVLARYNKTEDFANSELAIVLAPGQNYLMDVSVVDENGNQVMQVSQGI